MSDFAYVPSYPAERGGAFKVKRAEFGEGYVQTAADGINPFAQEWVLTFENIDTTTAKAITDYLEGKGGHTTFTWTPPSPWNTEIRVICEEVPRWRFTGPNCGTLVCQFKQRFNV
jgi:phage-related protein